MEVKHLKSAALMQILIFTAFIITTLTVNAAEKTATLSALSHPAAIASAHPLATQAGLAILEKGGNAFDAAVAMASTLAVVEPYASGIGGGGFWLLHIAKTNKNIFVDSREVAPSKAFSTMYLDKAGKVVPGLSLNGPLAAGIPGEAAAWDHIVKQYGKLDLTQDLAAAIKYAKAGFPVDKIYLRRLASRRQVIEKYPASKKIFMPQGEVPKLGDLIKQLDLANTLATLATKGSAGFYQGIVASNLVSAVQSAGGIWTLQDLKNYRVQIRQPLYGSIGNYRIVTAPPPSAGGLAILTMLRILSHYDLVKLSFVARAHYIIEAMRLAYWDRNRYLGDPHYVTIPMQALNSWGHAKHLMTYIKPKRATPSSTLGKIAIFQDSSDTTTHIVAMDKFGNWVSATLTINYYFGSGFVAAHTGVLLNDEMDDFAKKPGTKNVFGLVGGRANIIVPGKRPLSSMSPTFVIGKQRIAILGTPGGSRIPTMVLLGILDFMAGNDASSMVSVPRLHMQYLPDKVFHEAKALTPSQITALQAMGYVIAPASKDYGNMHAITWNKRNNKVVAASDPRGIGNAVVLNRRFAPS